MRIASHFTCCPVNLEYLRKKSQIKKSNYAQQHVRTDYWCMWMKSLLNLSWWRSLLYRIQSIDLQNKSMNLFLYNKNLCHERFNALLLACIHWDIFLDYDKIIDIYTSKHLRRMLLINPLSKNWTFNMFNDRKTHKAYNDFNIFSLHFIVVIRKNFHFASNN